MNLEMYREGADALLGRDVVEPIDRIDPFVPFQ